MFLQLKNIRFTPVLFLFCFPIATTSINAQSSFTLPSFNQSLVPNSSACAVASNPSSCLLGEAQNTLSNFFASAKGDLQKDFQRIFSDFGLAFGQNYGNAVLNVANLTNPIGLDNLGTFPNFNTGLGLGASFANKNSITNSLAGNTDLPIGQLPILPALGIGVNAGIGLSEDWDLHLSVLPPFEMAIPNSLLGDGGFSMSLSIYSAKLRAVQQIKKANPLSFGISMAYFGSIVGGNMKMSTGETVQSPISINENNSNGLGTNITATMTPTFTSQVHANWFYYSIGAELKIWFDTCISKFCILVPYVGWGISSQGGLFSTTFQADVTNVTAGTITVGGNNSAINQNDALSVSQEFKVSPYWFLNRFIIGLEIKVVLISIATEVQFDTINKLAGISLGISFHF